MKKTLWIALTVILVCVLSLSACDEKNDELQSLNSGGLSNESTHIHSFGDWITDTDASCTTNGLQVRFCSGCTNVDTKEIHALGHTTSNGTCTRCYQQIGNSSNGNNNGNSAKENYSFNEKWIIDNEWEFEILSAEPHAACSTQTNAAQYVMITFRYKNIGNTNPNGLSFSEYDFNVYDSQGNLATSYFCYEHVKSNAFIDKGTTHTASAVFEFSQKTQTIKIVVKQYDSDYDLYKATFNGTITTCSHNVVTEKGYAATCQSEGVSDYKYCSRCGEVIAEKTSLPKTGHQWSALSCTEARKCEICNFSDGEKLDHNYSQGKCTMCSAPEPLKAKYFTFGDKASFHYEVGSSNGDFTVSVGSSYTKITYTANKYVFVYGQQFVRIPIQITNDSDTTNSLRSSLVKLYDSNNNSNNPENGIYSNHIVSDNTFDDGHILDDIRPHSTYSGAIYIPYTGAGTYALVITDSETFDYIFEFEIQ